MLNQVHFFDATRRFTGRIDANAKGASKSKPLALRCAIHHNGTRIVPEYRFHNTFHAIQRVDLRNLSLEDIKNVVRYPGSKKRSPATPHHRGQVFIFEKTVGKRTLKVVAEIKDSDCWLITSYELT